MTYGQTTTGGLSGWMVNMSDTSQHVSHLLSGSGHYGFTLKNLYQQYMKVFFCPSNYLSTNQSKITGNKENYILLDALMI